MEMLFGQFSVNICQHFHEMPKVSLLSRTKWEVKFKQFKLTPLNRMIQQKIQHLQKYLLYK